MIGRPFKPANAVKDFSAIMNTTRREFIQTSALASLASVAPVHTTALHAHSSPEDHQRLDAFELASRHPLVRTKPGPTYFEGMLLGNGDVGVCAVVRPDALGLHISKSDCWDIRVTEGTDKDVRPFSEILAMWRKASEELKREGKDDSLSVEDAEFFRAYCERVGASYRKKWPRPWPCGTVWLKWDARWVEPQTYSLNPANGVFILDLKVEKLDEAERVARLTAFVDRDSGLLIVGTDAPVPDLSVIYFPSASGRRHHAGADTRAADAGRPSPKWEEDQWDPLYQRCIVGTSNTAAHFLKPEKPLEDSASPLPMPAKSATRDAMTSVLWSGCKRA